MKFPIPVMAVLAQTLAVQVELNLGDVDEDIEEITDLCDELLNSDISVEFVINPIADLASAIKVNLKGHLDWKIRSDKVMNCPRGSQKKKKDQGLFFFEMGSGHGLSTYVSRHLSIYGNGTSISE